MIGAGERAERLGREGNQDTTHKMSLTKNPTNPMTMNPRPVRSATLLNSLRSGLVHLFRSRMESLAKSRTGLTAMSATSMLRCYHSCVFDSGRCELECGDRDARVSMSLAEVCDSPPRWVIIRLSSLGKSGLQSSPRPFARAKRPLG